MAAREDAAAAHEKAAVGVAAELEQRVASFDAKEKKALRVGGRWHACDLCQSAAGCVSCGLRAPPLLPPSSTHQQELSDRESAQASRESKLAQQHADLAERGGALQAAKARLESDRRSLEQREEALQAAQAEVGRGSVWLCLCAARLLLSPAACICPFACLPCCCSILLQVRKARTSLELARGELEDGQKRLAHRETRVADLEAQVGG